MGSKMGHLSSPDMTFYRLPIVTVGLSQGFRSASDIPYRRTGGRTVLVYIAKSSGTMH